MKVVYQWFPASWDNPTQPVSGSIDPKELGVKGDQKLPRTPHIIVSGSV